MVHIITRNGITFQVSECDLPLVHQYRWSAYQFGRHRKIWYVVTAVEQKTVYLHRLIATPPHGHDVDHADGDGLNNTRENLRVCSHALNLRNCRPVNGAASGFRGVYRHGAWYRARAWVNGKQTVFGKAKAPEEAARIYDAAMSKLFGEFAVLNFPEAA